MCNNLVIRSVWRGVWVVCIFILYLAHKKCKERNRGMYNIYCSRYVSVTFAERASRVVAYSMQVLGAVLFCTTVREICTRPINVVLPPSHYSPTLRVLMKCVCMCTIFITIDPNRYATQASNHFFVYTPTQQSHEL